MGKSVLQERARVMLQFDPTVSEALREAAVQERRSVKSYVQVLVEQALRERQSTKEPATR